MEQQILDGYSDIFQSYGDLKSETLEAHINKLKELDTFLPHSSTFFCITNTTTRSFEYVSKNFTTCTGLNITEMCSKGMTFWWEQMHPEEMKTWILSLTELMEFTMLKIPIEERRKLSYSWNYRIRVVDNTYRSILQHTTPMYFDNEGKPIIGLAHYSLLPPIQYNIPIQATIKILNQNNEYETIFHKVYSSEKLLSEGLTNRERDILRLLSFGYNSAEIGDKLNISNHTVNSHRKNILKKSNCRNTTELVSHCIREGLI